VVTVLGLTVAFVALNRVTDLVYAKVDPRVAHD